MCNRISQSSAFLIMMAALAASVSLSHTNAWAAVVDKHNVYPSGGEYYPHVDNSYCNRVR